MDGQGMRQGQDTGKGGMRVILWTQPICPLCQQVKAYFAEVGYEERAASELTSGADRDPEAMAQLAMQNMELPMIQVNGAFVSPRAILSQTRAA